MDYSADYHSQELIRKELDFGETYIWSGRPKQGILFRGSDVFLIPFSLLWGGFAIFWEVSVLAFPHKESGPSGIIFPLFGIPFVLIGLYMIFGRFIYDAKKRTKTCYGLTDQRVIILSGRKVKSLNLRTLTDIALSEKSDGRGTISFGRENSWSPWHDASGFPGTGASQTPKFEFIENAKDVYNKIRNAQKQS